MEKESEKKTHNTAYIPTKCRVTKPVPPKPATNPLQFVAVKPNPLLIKAQESVKKVEIVKEAHKERKEEAEEWQSNLDSWKSSRRKRHEHIIERVEEVKKLELEEKERSRRRGTTFSEIVEKRNKGRFSIPIYDNDSNDLSDYGIGSSSSKTNSIKDVDTDDNSSILDEKENSYDEATTTTITTTTTTSTPVHVKDDDEEKTIATNVNPTEANSFKNEEHITTDKKEVANGSMHSKPVISNEQYTYEGAIEDYRSRIRSKININEAAFEKFDAPTVNSSNKSRECSEVQSLLPRGSLCERKKMFENNNMNEATVPKQIGEDLMNTQSIKERLQSLEKCTEQQQTSTTLTVANKTDDILVGNLKTRLTQFNNATCDSDAKNNNPRDDHAITKSGIEFAAGEECSEFETNPNGYDAYLDKLKSAHFDALYMKSEPEMNGFRPSTSSSDLVATSSDREDSGIHTADVSCSVSQSDEPVDDITQECQNFKVITDSFLHGEKEYADKTHVVVPPVPECPPTTITHSPLVENIAKTIQAVPLNELNEPEINEKVFDFYQNERTPFTMDSINAILINPMPPKLKPPTEKPPPPPPLANDDNDMNANSISPSIRIKKELLIKRSSFLGLEESAINEQLEQLEIQEKQKENEQIVLQQEQQQQQKQLNLLSTIEATTDEEEIMKKEREIIEMVEKEEKFKDHDHLNEIKNNESKDFPKSITNTVLHSATEPITDIYLGNKKFDEPFYPEPCYNDLSDQDSEVLKVEQELLQLEKEELKRQRENMLFQERSAKLNQPSNSYENMYYHNNDYYAKNKNMETRKSMPDLKNIPIEQRPPQPQVFHNTPPTHEALRYQKSMPNIQQVQQQNKPTDYYSSAPKYDLGIPVGHRKSMPDLDRTIKSAFTPTLANNNLLMPIKPLKPIEKKERYKIQHPMESDAYMRTGRGMPRHVTPNPPPAVRSRSTPREPWIQPKANPQAKSYNQHWLYQEAELRRLADQQKAAAMVNRQNHHVIDNNMMEPKRISNEIKSPKRSVDPMLSQKDYVNVPYMGRQPQPAALPQTYGHALPMSYPQSMAVEEGQDVILSVSGKKKCSYCNNELGRGAAMIIESLSLFYHMECFKCCVCHMELGDGLMGTDVRVRNQKLHCHNCYSSDDGIKFSCV